MKTCACVITYRPDGDLLDRNIACYAGTVDEVVIWQNTPAAERALYPIPSGDKIRLMGEEDNIGISAALNRILAYCHEKGFDLLLTMDQDSLFHNFGAYHQRVINLLSEQKNAFAFGPEVNSHKLKNGETEHRRYLITSGSLVVVEKAVAIGGYSEKFFVDGIDIDFGYKAMAHGYHCVCVGGFCLEQSYGNTTEKGGIKYAAYSAARLKNIVWGYWQVIKDYWPKSFPLVWEVTNRYYLRKALAVALFQEDKWKKLKAIFLMRN